MAKIYEVEGLGKWNIEEEKFVQAINATDEVIKVDIPKEENKLEGIKNVLEFEGFPTNTLMSDSNRLEILINQNRDFIINTIIFTSLNAKLPNSAEKRLSELKEEIAKFSDHAKINLFRD